MNSEQIIRKAYGAAEKMDLKGWVDAFTPPVERQMSILAESVLG